LHVKAKTLTDMNKVIYSVFLLAVILTSCKKDKNGGEVPVSPPGSTNASALDLLKDSVYAYAREEYLWYDALPEASVFNPRQFTGSSDGAALQAEIDAFSQLKKNPSTNQAYEYDAGYPGTAKYSYIDEGQAATSIGGTSGDFGFSVFYNAYNDLRIRYVYPNSPASTSGIARGYKVTAINNSTNIYYNPNAADPNSDPNLLAVVRALGGNSITLTVQKPDNSTATVTINKGTYTINPVIKYSVITTASGKKVGYFAFSRFTVLDNARAKIDEAFAYFAANNITELVVDLRYNGGGAVETSKYIADYIVPASKNGTVMFSERFNSKLQSDNYPLLARKYRIDKGDFSLARNTFSFTKMGTLNLNRAFFIVTGSTASASELLINNLLPALPGGVQIIGRTTYGKPVGFFRIPVGKYDLYISEFESQNSQGKADFYQGMIPGGNFPGVQANDDVTKDFGDPAEGLFAKAINFIEKGNYTTASLREASLSSTDQKKVQDVNHVIELKQHEFKGAVRTKDLKLQH
jgi:carboxyl-terminal processing protease